MEYKTRSQKKWEAIKADPEKLEKWRVSRKEYYLRKKAERRGINNKYRREWAKSMREVAKDIGNCSCCFKQKDDDRYKMCIKCRKINRDLYKKRREKQNGKSN